MFIFPVWVSWPELVWASGLDSVWELAPETLRESVRALGSGLVWESVQASGLGGGSGVGAGVLLFSVAV